MARQNAAKEDDPTAPSDLVPPTDTTLPPGNAEMLENLKARVRTAPLCQ
jgi:hypothetical protein